MAESRGMEPSQRSRLLVGVCIAAGAAYMQPATFNYIVTPMLVTFGQNQSSGALLREVPSIASLLVIFVAAMTASRFGERRVITAGAILLTLGSALVAAAPAFGAAVAGLAVQAVGATVLLVVPLGVIGAGFAGRDARATAFAVFSMVSPLVFVLLPVVAAALMESSSWRVVAATWVVGGLAALVAGRWALPPGLSPARTGGEWWTPMLAGVTCVGLVQAISHASSDGVLATSTLLRLAVAVVAAAALVLVLRHTARPSLDVAMMRRSGVVLLLVAIGLWCFTQLWYYMTLAYEYVYGLSVLETALLMVPAQACAALGARTAGPIVRRRGITAAGTWLLMLTGASLALSASVHVSSPLWWPLLVTCLYSYAAVAAGVPMTNALMDAATPGAEGGASAFRQAAISVGTVAGIAVISALVFATFSASISAQLDAAEVPAAEASQIAQQLRSGASAQEVASSYAVPAAEVQVVGEALQRAYLDGMAAHGWAGAVLSALTAGVFVASRRLVDRGRRTGAAAR
ncbi:MAG: MFS transporter [Candidatus Nanopelagicales bacterium]